LSCLRSKLRAGLGHQRRAHGAGKGKEDALIVLELLAVDRLAARAVAGREVAAWRRGVRDGVSSASGQRELGDEGGLTLNHEFADNAAGVREPSASSITPTQAAAAVASPTTAAPAGEREQSWGRRTGGTCCPCSHSPSRRLRGRGSSRPADGGRTGRKVGKEDEDEVRLGARVVVAERSESRSSPSWE